MQIGLLYQVVHFDFKPGTNILGPSWISWFTNVSKATFNVIAVLTCIGTAYAYTKELKGDAIFGAVIALVSFWILTPSEITLKAGKTVETVGGFTFTYLGSDGLFLALITALVSVRIFMSVYKRGWTIKMPEGVPPMVADSFKALIPSFFVLFTFFLVRLLFQLTPYQSVHNFIFEVLQTPLKGVGNTLIAQCINTLFISLFWFFGINGPAITNTIFAPIVKIVTIENLNAFQAGHPLPNILTDPFVNFFKQFGGGGSTLSLVIVMLLFCHSQRIRQLGKLAIFPGIFGINEPVIFGLPIVLNPILLVPFTLVPLVNLVLSYSAMYFGILPYTTGISIPWTTPIFFSGFLSTGSWLAAFFQLFLLVLGCLIYYPFIKILDNQYLRDEREAEAADQSEEDLAIDFSEV